MCNNNNNSINKNNNICLLLYSNTTCSHSMAAKTAAGVGPLRPQMKTSSTSKIRKEPVKEPEIVP